MASLDTVELERTRGDRAVGADLAVNRHFDLARSHGPKWRSTATLVSPEAMVGVPAGGCSRWVYFQYAVVDSAAAGGYALSNRGMMNL
jgi:hypothetical protein